MVLLWFCLCKCCLNSYWRFYNSEVGPNGAKLDPKMTLANYFQRSPYERFVVVAVVMVLLLIPLLSLQSTASAQSAYTLLINVRNHRVKVFKNGPSKICGRQSLRNLKWLWCAEAQRLSSTNFTWSILEYLHPIITQKYCLTVNLSKDLVNNSKNAN